MKNFITAALLLSSLNLWAQEFPAKGYRDDTANIMNALSKGLVLSEERSIEGIQIKLHLTKGALKAIDKKAFLVKDDNFNQEKFNAFIFKAFQSSLQYYRAISPGNELSELNLVVVDETVNKTTLSEAEEDTRVIKLRLDRWHKFYLKNTEHYAQISSIHEFAHVVNYMYSPSETKLHRELSSILIECLNFIKLYELDVFSKGYLFYYASNKPSQSDLLNSEYTNMDTLRYLAFNLMTNVHNGTYKGSEEARPLLEKLAVAYLKNPTDGTNGLNQAFEQAGLLDSTGKALTLETLQNDTNTYVKSLPAK